MRLTPLDIKKQEFRRTFRGYDPAEVDAFLEMVADEYEELVREKNDLADEVLKLRTQLRDYQEVERSLKETLLAAQQTMAESRESSRREAELIIREAQVKAEEILEGARKQLAELRNEILTLRSQKESLARRLRHLLESQLELLGLLEVEDIRPEGRQVPSPASGSNPQGGSRFLLASEGEATEAEPPQERPAPPADERSKEGGESVIF